MPSENTDFSALGGLRASVSGAEEIWGNAPGLRGMNGELNCRRSESLAHIATGGHGNATADNCGLSK